MAYVHMRNWITEESAVESVAEGTCLIERNGPVLEVTINRPAKGNVLTPMEHELLDKVWRDFEADDSLRVAILCANGDRIFCAGNDLKYALENEDFPMPATGMAGLTNNHAREKPIIAAVNGAAVGGGFEIALACDLIVAASHVVFSLPEAAAGTYAGAGGLTRLPAQVGEKLTLELALTGRKLSAERACQLGLVNSVVESDSVLTEARQMAQEIIANSPVACAVSMRILNQTRDIPDLARSQEICDQLGKEVIDSEDFKEGVCAFLEKRRPEWSGQ